MSMCDTAIGYTKINLAVFPVEAHGKKPLTEHGCKDATTDTDKVRRWWKKWPDANIGIATGKKSEGIYVIDLDIDDDRGIDGYLTFRDWERDNGVFPESWRAITGRGGYHMYFKSEKVVKNKTALLDGVDIRGEGGYVVAPPSVHQNGRSYEWEVAPEDIPIAEADDLLNTLLNTTTKFEKPGKSFEVPKVIKKGERNSMLFKAACSYQSKGLPDSAILGAVMALNNDACETPLPEDEVRTLVESALKYDKGVTVNDHEMDPGEDDDEPHFRRDSKGRLLQTSQNVVEAIDHDPQLNDSVKFNALAYSAYVYGKVPWEDEIDYREWTNFDDSNLNTYIEDKYGLTNRTKIQEGFEVFLDKKKFNPVIDCLSDIYKNKWDHQTGHIENLLPDYMGVEKNIYSTEVMRLLMLGAINRAYYPGCKFDYMPVLVGKQGIGKSTFFRYLALDSHWYNDNFNTVEGDKASEKLRGMWIVEMAELLATKKAKEIESIKSFLTSTIDAYRPPYERRTEQRKRMCVFVGTTNNEQFLTDRTGNRRFLPLVAREDYIKKSLFDDPESVKRDFENAWGEALDYFWHNTNGTRLILSKEASEYALQMQDKFTEEDARTGLIQEWLDRTDRDLVCRCMIYREALGHEDMSPTPRESNEIAAIMANEIVGWKKIEKKTYCPGYGTVACYERADRAHENFGSKSAARTNENDGFVPLGDENDIPFD